MKKKWIALLCGAACTASLFMPVGLSIGNTGIGQTVVCEAEEAQYDGTVTIPVTDNLEPVKEVTMQGTISNTNTEDVYLLNVEESAVTLTIEGNIDNMSVDMDLQTLMGNTLKHCPLFEYSPMIDTTTASRQTGVQNYYLAKGQYLCKISKNYVPSYAPENPEMSYTVKAYSIDAGTTKSISFGKKYLAYGRSAVQYKKITVKKPGKLTIKSNKYKNLSEVYDTQLVNNDGDYFTLCDKNKKELTKEQRGTTVKSYGVKKGTYYIKLSNPYDDYRVYSASFTSADLAGNKTKTAKTVTKNWKSYTMLSGGTPESTAQWFKFKLDKPRKLKLYVTNLSDGAVSVRIYKKNKEDGSFTVKAGGNSGPIHRVSNNKEIKWDKGTYYVKVSKYYDDASGGIIKVKLK